MLCRVGRRTAGPGERGQDRKTTIHARVIAWPWRIRANKRSTSLLGSRTPSLFATGKRDAYTYAKDESCGDREANEEAGQWYPLS